MEGKGRSREETGRKKNRTEGIGRQLRMKGAAGRKQSMQQEENKEGIKAKDGKGRMKAWEVSRCERTRNEKAKE
jgi:hypothetical protein